MKQPNKPNVTKDLIEYLKYTFQQPSDSDIIDGGKPVEKQVLLFHKRAAQMEIFNHLQRLLDDQMVSGGTA